MPNRNSRLAYAFELPGDLIAQRPPARRADARLLVFPRRTGTIAHRSFRDLPELLAAGDLLVLNDTRVFSARVELFRSTGGRIAGLLLELPTSPRFRMMLEGKGKLKEGDVLFVDVASNDEASGFRLVESEGSGFWRVECADGPSRERLVTQGRMPLPPYIHREKGSDPRDAEDRERYQTIFAANEGAVAAPTAGLHFSEEVLAEIRDKGVEVATITLHVGPGTFLPVRADDLDDHTMHRERFIIPEATATAIATTRAAGGRVVAVGTTVVRALEASARDATSGVVRPGASETEIFIRPPFDFRVVDAMVTNFHLPESTLLMLVAAFAGYERTLDAYRAAVQERYRFFSYGDAMFIADLPGASQQPPSSELRDDGV